ncbi:MAG: hypothetical protein KatS3mg042_0622 [Rhodothermaceae bacterium]|nr:MAG: hypothetical protein KatS3mg042_0622 [Rhodothermaceae bacterium]
MSGPNLSILICTRDRLEALKETLASVGRLELPPGLTAELVVVDNGSTDGTAAWVRSARLPNMPVRLVEEPRPGTGYARTTALYAARGEILLFTDDDVRLPPRWADAMTAPIRAGLADVVGGTSVLAPHLERPWMTPFHRVNLSVSVERGAGDPHPITISMALHRRVLARVPAFDPELGPGSAYGFQEDTLFAKQLILAGFRVVWVRDVPVEHHPDAARLTRRAFLAAARRRGRAMTYLRYHWQHGTEADFTHRKHPWEVWRAPRVVLVKRWLHLGLWRLTHPRAVWRTEGIDPVEFGLVNQLAQIRQYLRERGRPRHYDRYGLVKKRGVLPDVPVRGDAQTVREAGR